MLGALPQSSQARETLIWLLRDLPPLTIADGAQKGQGAIDQLMPLLIASMPEYQHKIVRVNRARGMQMLREPAFVCDPSLVWNQERARWVVFSITSFRVLSNGLITRRKDREALAPFISDGKVDLAALLGSGLEKVGVIAERSYGQQVDTLLHQAPTGSVNTHYGNDALGSLLQMQRLGRLQVLLGYWPEIRYQALQQGIAPKDLEFYPIKGAPKYQAVHVGCSNTPQGKHTIAVINKALRQLREDKLVDLYAAWLEPPMRDEYKADARAYFHGAQRH